jgi:lysozyme family protein
VVVTFEDCFAVVVGHEGGLSTDRGDPGNWTGGKVGEGAFKGTKFGIAAHVYPQLDIANLTLGEAVSIYKRDFWVPIRGDELPAAWRLPVFDAAVNMGVGTAVRMMQDALGVMVDGRIGPRTLAALQAADNRKLARFFARRVKRYSELQTFPRHWDGWLTRAFVTAMESASA